VAPQREPAGDGLHNAGHDAWGRGLFPGMAILSLVMGANFAGDSLLDPHAW